MKKVKFLYFEDDKGNKTNVAFAPGYYWDPEHLDDIVVKCEIVNDKVILSIVFDPNDVPPWTTKKEYLKEINSISKDLNKNSNWDAWEFFNFYPTKELKNGEDIFSLVADDNSESFDLVYSPQNMKNLKKMEDYLKNNK